MADQLVLRFPSAPVDADTESILQLVAGDPLHEDDRAAVVRAILAAAAADGGRVDPNAVRKLIPDNVYPRVIGATYLTLAKKGLLVVDGWTVSEDRAGRNTGKPCRLYRLNTSAARAA
ncbi:MULTISPECIES: hypothetical protein [Amycolatopsis]|uniref:hypothetical protein n=1 Tax=Amycolatopsis TaxID=1813 RepID=UPI000B8B738A|nr:MULTISPECIES: hypothetical protein [Amycolatopsis]OXM73073.1 hypothetical protein CF166_11155 [Amycolatopsis sp. KNN50.9b]